MNWLVILVKFLLSEGATIWIISVHFYPFNFVRKSRGFILCGVFLVRTSRIDCYCTGWFVDIVCKVIAYNILTVWTNIQYIKFLFQRILKVSYYNNDSNKHAMMQKHSKAEVVTIFVTMLHDYIVCIPNEYGYLCSLILPIWITGRAE